MAVVSPPSPPGTTDDSKFTSIQHVKSKAVCLHVQTHREGGRRTGWKFKFRVTGTYCAGMLRFTQQQLLIQL